MPQTIARIVESRYKSICVVSVEGRITLGRASDALSRLLNFRIGEGLRFHVLDLSQVEFIDSAGLGTLVSAVSRVRLHSGRMIVIASESVAKVLKIARLDTFESLEPASDLPSAISKLREVPTKTVKLEDANEVFAVFDDGQFLDKTRDLQSVPSGAATESTGDAKTAASSLLQLAGTAAVALVVICAVIFGLVWAVHQVSSIFLLTLVFAVAIILIVFVLILILAWSGKLGEKDTGRLLNAILTKVPGLKLWVPRLLDKK
jgi:anti-sigma B factor antagonist